MTDPRSNKTAQSQSLQVRYASKSICFGCGPANKDGLRIQTFVQGDLFVAQWQPELKHQAFPGVLNGGIVGALLDCHSNWSAAYSIMRARNLNEPPCTVTAEFSVKLLRPTPVSEVLELKAQLVELISAPDSPLGVGDKAIIHAEIWGRKSLDSELKKTAVCTGTFVAVGPDHPAFHRW
jgi:acyl-coenzyme A thioesterase PaaI-like protein